MDSDNIEKRLNILSIYSVISTALILFLAGWMYQLSSDNFKRSQIGNSTPDHIPHLTVERLDIIEPDGRLAIALSNSEKSAKLRFDGQIINGASNRDIPNIIFFDGKGDEVGGLAFANFREEEGPFTAIRHLAFDGFRQDEVITLSHFVQQGRSRKGLYIYDRPEIPIMEALKETGISPEDTPQILGEKLDQFEKEDPVRYQEIWSNPQRVAVQTNEDNEAEFVLADAEGNVRLRFVVSAAGESFIEFSDSTSKVVKRITP